MSWERIALIGACCLAATAASNAAPVTFSFDSIVTGQTPGPDIIWPAQLAVGNPLHLDVQFDAAADRTRTRLDGAGNPTVFDFDPSSLRMTLTAGTLVATQTFASMGAGLIRLRDDALDPDGIGDLVDGLTLQLRNTSDPFVETTFGLTLRGPVLDLITAGALPTAQDPRWSGLRLASFTLCRSNRTSPDSCDMGSVSSTLISVPEPSALSLAVAALAALGWIRQRRPAPAGHTAAG
jgi:hypothetical protein